MHPRNETAFPTAELNPDKIPDEGGGAGLGMLYSVLAHLLLVIVLLGMSWILRKRAPEEVRVFELVSLEEPKLRPLRPKVKPPPEPPPKPEEPVRPEDPPKLSPKPEKPVKKPEPKAVREDPDTTKKQVDMVQVFEESVPQVEMRNVEDTRLSLWAARVKKKAELMWNPPAGIDILGGALVVVNFTAHRDGLVEDPRITQSSGNPTLDDIALRAVIRMERVPPLPPNFPDDKLEVGMEFPYRPQ